MTTKRKPIFNVTWHRIVTREGDHCARVGDPDPKRAFIQARIALSAVYRNHRIAPETFDMDPPFVIVDGQHVQYTVVAVLTDDDCKVASHGPYATQAAASAQFHRLRKAGARRVAMYQDHRRIAHWASETDISAVQAKETVA